MISIKTERFNFTFKSEFDILPNGTIQNEIIPLEMSEFLEDKIIIKNGNIKFDGKTFNLVYYTESIDHTFSVLGQFCYFMNDYLESLEIVLEQRNTNVLES